MMSLLLSPEIPDSVMFVRAQQQQYKWVPQAFQGNEFELMKEQVTPCAVAEASNALDVLLTQGAVRACLLLPRDVQIGMLAAF